MTDEPIKLIFGILAAGIFYATPYLFAALGETLGQRSGVLNLGVEGIMLVGAVSAYIVALATDSAWLGLVAAIIVGGLLGLLTAFINVTLKAEQGISGIGLYLFGLGLSELLFFQLVPKAEPVSRLDKLEIPLFDNSPSALVRGIEQAFFSHNFLVYLAFALVPIIAFILNRTTLGLKIRAVGQSPQAADTLGVSVERVRYLTVTTGGVLSGIAGASLTIALNNIFQPNMTSGLGFIAVALVYFAGWRPIGILIGAMLFSIAYAMQFRAQILHIPISPDIAVMLPYLVTIVALVVAVQRVHQPAALTKIFERGE